MFQECSLLDIKKQTSKNVADTTFNNALVGMNTLNLLEYARILNVSDAVHSVKSRNKLLSSYRDRRIQSTVKHLRWSVLQKELSLSAGAQAEIFQSRKSFVEVGHFDKYFVKNTRKKSLARKRFFSPRHS